MAVSDYNTNPLLNIAISGIDIAELCSPAGYNNALRQIMADIKAWTDSYPAGLSAAYQRLPQVAKSAAFSFSLDMDGGHVRYTGAAAAATINPNATTAFPRDAVILIVNDGSGALTITRGAGVALIWAASGADANRTIAVGGMAMIVQVATNRWFISGAGIS